MAVLLLHFSGRWFFTQERISSSPTPSLPRGTKRSVIKMSNFGAVRS
ncbi:hypothetical protein RDI58_023874 [Solanum bulbocastanum]|uniref:Uncharacterized protein n=1 Tax=Solanum bulbocastanum TaxID=147425 RepID=A0AAN8SZV6_SOLBU